MFKIERFFKKNLLFYIQVNFRYKAKMSSIPKRITIPNKVSLSNTNFRFMIPIVSSLFLK